MALGLGTGGDRWHLRSPGGRHEGGSAARDLTEPHCVHRSAVRSWSAGNACCVLCFPAGDTVVRKETAGLGRGDQEPRPRSAGAPLAVLSSVIDPRWGLCLAVRSRKLKSGSHSALRHQSGGRGRRPQADVASESSLLFESLQRVWEAAGLGGFWGTAVCLPSTLFPGLRRAQWVVGTSLAPHHQ